MTTGRIIRDRISRTDLASLAEEQFGDWIEFDSMTNLRPSQGNRGRIREVVESLVP